jgi:hypothetical protein
MFASIEDESTQVPTKSINKEADMVILSSDAAEECFKMVLCYDKKSNSYQFWKKYRPKYVKLA